MNPTSGDDYELLLNAAPHPYLVLAPDISCTIVAANDGYLAATGMRREDICGRGLFEVFPVDLDAAAAKGVADLRRSLEKVLRDAVQDTMAVYQYEIPGHGDRRGEFRYWRPINTPVLDSDGQIRYIIHHVEDLTDTISTSEQQAREIAEQERKTAAYCKRLRAEIMQHGELAKEANRQLEATIEVLEYRESELAGLKERMEESIRARATQERLAQSVMDNISEGAFITDPAMRIMVVNRAFSDITGYSTAEAIGQKPLFLRSMRTPHGTYAAILDALGSVGSWKGELWDRRKNGELFLERLAINAIDADEQHPLRYIGIFSDITELRRKDEHLQHLAFYDVLTDLPNRLLLQDRLQHALERAGRERRRLGVLFVDLDGFKSVNDTLGHETGDVLLQNVATRLRSNLRSMDTVARLGGDEFVIVLEEIDDPSDCAMVAHNVIAGIGRPLEVDQRLFSVGASIGIAIYPEDGKAAVELIRRADAAMYAAKAAGGNCFHFVSPQATAKA